MLCWRPRLSGSKTSEVRRCLCGNQRGSGKDGGDGGWVRGQQPVLRGSALLGMAHPVVEQPKPRLQPRTLFAACTLLGAGPALTVSELVAALWPNRWLALLRRLTVLPFEGLLYLAWLGAAAAGCWGWQLDVGPRGHVACACHHVPRALTVLSAHWYEHAQCALSCTPVSSCARAQSLARSGFATALCPSPTLPGPRIFWA